MIFWNVESYVDGTTGTVRQTYKTKAGAIKNAYKRIKSGCYNCVLVWKENTEKPTENKIYLDLWKDRM